MRTKNRVTPSSLRFLTEHFALARDDFMNFLKRATPWMITLVILLGVYVASFFWYYKPKFGYGRLHASFTPSKGEHLFLFYKPMVKWEEEREKQNARKELLSQCQGEWQGWVRPRSDGLADSGKYIQVQAIIEGDQFKILRAESMPELTGVTWKIGCLFDAENQYGISSNKSYPKSSSIFLAYERSPAGVESLDEGYDFSLGGKPVIVYSLSKQLVRPATTPTHKN